MITAIKALVDTLTLAALGWLAVVKLLPAVLLAVTPAPVPDPIVYETQADVVARLDPTADPFLRLKQAEGDITGIQKRLADAEFAIDKLNENFLVQADQIDRLITLMEKQPKGELHPKVAQPSPPAIDPPKTGPILVPWQYDVTLAKAKAKELGRPILIAFCQQKCPPCDQLEEAVYKTTKVMSVLKTKFVPVWMYGSDSNPAGWQVASEYGVDRWPTVVICDDNSCRKIVPIPDPDKFLEQITPITPLER